MITGLFKKLFEKPSLHNNFREENFTPEGHFLDLCWGSSHFDNNKLTARKYITREEADQIKDDIEQNRIVYEINSNGYRTSTQLNAKIFSDKKYNSVACFGCSNTYGIGLHWDTLWTTLLNNKLGDEWVVKNYGRSGASTDTMVRLIYMYLLKEQPKAICCLFPDARRLEGYDNGLTNYCPQFWAPSGNSKEKHQAYLEVMSDAYAQYTFIKNFKFIQALCACSGVEFYWYTWSDIILNWKDTKIKKYLNYDNFLSDISEPFKLFWDTPKARDLQHFGEEVHKTLGEGFYKKISGG